MASIVYCVLLVHRHGMGGRCRVGGGGLPVCGVEGRKLGGDRQVCQWLISALFSGQRGQLRGAAQRERRLLKGPSSFAHGQ